MKKTHKYSVFLYLHSFTIYVNLLNPQIHFLVQKIEIHMTHCYSINIYDIVIKGCRESRLEIGKCAPNKCFSLHHIVGINKFVHILLLI